jgi:hypothetical protein
MARALCGCVSFADETLDMRLDKTLIDLNSSGGDID